MRRAIVFVAAMLCLATTAFAQNSIDDLYVDFAVPDTPALGLFGLTPNKVARPGNLKELAAAVLPVSAADDKIGAGVAFSWAPVFTFAKSVDSYRSGWARRIALSAATVKDSKTDTVRVGVGARILLIDDSDPLLDEQFNIDVLRILSASLKGSQERNRFWNGPLSPFLNEIVGKMTSDTVAQAGIKDRLLTVWDLTKIPAGLTSDQQLRRFQVAIDNNAAPDKGIKRVDLANENTLLNTAQRLSSDFVVAQPPPPASSKAELTKRRKQFMADHWQAPVVSVEVGELASSADGSWGDLKADQFGASFSAALPASKSGQLIIQVQDRKGLGDSPAEDWYVSAGGRLLLGNATKRFSVEGLISHTKATDVTKDGQTKRLTVGTEFRVSEGFWLEVALGNEWTPSTKKGTNLLSVASLKYAFKTKARFTEIPGVTDDDK